MTATAAQIAANRRNAKKSTGPRTQAGKRRSRRNAVQHGLAGQGVALPEPLQNEVETLQADLEQHFTVSHPLARRLVEVAAIELARLGRGPKLYDAARLEHARRAAEGWEADRTAQASQLGGQLAKRPEQAVNELLNTAQGAEWLIDAWRQLDEILHAKGTWDDDQRRLAADLLAIPAAFRDDDPRLHPARTKDALKLLVADEIEAIEELQGELLEERNQRERDLAVRGFAFDLSPTAFKLLRYDTRAFHRFSWAWNRLERFDPTDERTEERLERWGFGLDEPTAQAVSLQEVSETPASSEPSRIASKIETMMENATASNEASGVAQPAQTTSDAAVSASSEKVEKPEPLPSNAGRRAERKARAERKSRQKQQKKQRAKHRKNRQGRSGSQAGSKGTAPQAPRTTSTPVDPARLAVPQGAAGGENPIEAIGRNMSFSSELRRELHGRSLTG